LKVKRGRKREKRKRKRKTKIAWKVKMNSEAQKPCGRSRLPSQARAEIPSAPPSPFARRGDALLSSLF
jgi:hypothetical protein